MVRALTVIGLLFIFLVAVQSLGGTFEAMGSGLAETLIRSCSNPFASLSIGILATVLVQSSSVTTATIVSIVGGMLATGAAGEDVDLQAFVAPFVPMVMGANIGTTITNTLVSLGHITRPAEFHRAFAGATVHDFFNLLTLVILLPIELLTHALSHAAVALVTVFGADSAVEFDSPIKAAVKGGYHVLRDGVGLVIPEATTAHAIAMVVLSIGLILVCLLNITRTMRRLTGNHLERAINAALRRSALLGLVIGTVVTVLVQSSSITTSIMVPLFAAGILTVQNGFPIMVGANIGTTVTALLASAAAGPAGLAMALVHLLFNVAGTVLFFPVPVMRRIPIRLATALAGLALRSRWYVVAYVVGVFVLIPLLGAIVFA